MLYLIDANTLITAKNMYYQMNRVPEFWSWLVFQGERAKIKIPLENYEEIIDKTTAKKDRDELSLWLIEPQVKAAILLEEQVDQDHVARVTYGGYTANPTDTELDTMGADPFLISYALRDINHRIIVTTEVSKPSRQGANRHIPDVCKTLGVSCINTFQLLTALDFRTDWQHRQ